MTDYCGSCASFYHPDCPHRFLHPGCSPAPNPHAPVIDWSKVADTLASKGDKTTDGTVAAICWHLSDALKAGIGNG